MCHDKAQALRKAGKQLELDRSQTNLHAIAACASLVEIDLRSPERKDLSRGWAHGAPKRCSDAGEKFADAERLRNVIVHTRVQRLDRGTLLRSRREHQHR